MSKHAVVIGAGITGSLSAVALAQAGWQVTLVEAQDAGSGSSSRSAACIRQQFSTESTVRAMRYCVDFYAAFFKHMGLKDESPVIVQNGYLFLHNDEQRWRAAKAHTQIQIEAGLDDVQALDPKTVVERFPFVDKTGLIGGTWCPSDGFLRPDLVYLGAVEALRALGARVMLNAPVQGGLVIGDRLAEIHTSRGKVGGDLFVNATNAWAPQISSMLGATELPISALKRYLYFLRRGSSMSGEELAAMPMTISPSRAYCRPENKEQMLLGWAHHAHADPDFGHESQDFIEPSFHHAQGLDNFGVRLWMELAGYLPPLMDFRGLDATTAGYYAATPDHNPIFDLDPNLPNLLHAAGFSGHGAMMGPFSARVVTALAENPKTQEIKLETGCVSLAAFKLDRDYEHSEAMVI